VDDHVDPASFPGFDPTGFTSFVQIQKEVEEFSHILTGLGINIEHGSPLENMCLTLLGLEEKRKNAALINLSNVFREPIKFFSAMRMTPAR